MTRAIEATQAWFEKAVIGLNLCPFAKAVHNKRQIRWVLSTAHDAEALLADLLAEMQLLAAADPRQIDTTLIVHPHALRDFGQFNAFLGVADAALDELDLQGTLQVASFHPQYRFAGTRQADVSNNTNRSPYPTLHLLREDSVARAVAAFPEAETIYERNIATLQKLGRAGWSDLMSHVLKDKG